MLPAATWLTAAALLTPVALASLTGAPVSAEPTGSPSASVSPSPSVSGSPSPSVSASPAPTESPSVSVSPTPSQTSPAPIEPAPEISPEVPAPTPTVAPELAMETQLATLGLPTGTIDGRIDARTRRALCAFRDLNSLRASRELPGAALTARIAQTQELPLLPRRLFGVKALVSLTCQATYVTNNAGVVVRVLPVSTGKDRGPHETRTGFKRVYYKFNDWQRSSLFPEPDGRPGLYRPIYFDRGIAFHGVRQPVRAFPQSHGCVRTWPKHQDWLWKQLRLRDKVFVYGNYWRTGTASLGGYGRA